VIRVFVAATEELVEVRDLRPGGSASGVVCSRDVYTPIRLTRRYHDFVSPPLGIVTRLYGGNTFCIELSSSIDSGDSWQLGVLLAHAAYAADRLFMPRRSGSVANTVVFATGKLQRHDLSASRV
jgi:hypothetical protein